MGIRRGFVAVLVVGALIGPVACSSSDDGGKADQGGTVSLDCRPGKEGRGVTVVPMRRDNPNGNLEGFYSPMAVGVDGAWLAFDSLGELGALQVDLKTGQTKTMVDIGVNPSDGMSHLAVGGGAFWHAANDEATGLVALTRVDPRTNKVVGQLQLDVRGSFAVGALPDAVWLHAYDDYGEPEGPVALRVDPRSGAITDRISTDGVLAAAHRLEFDLTGMWMLGDDDEGQGRSTLVRLDLGTKQLKTIDLPTDPSKGEYLGSLAVGADAVWVSGIRGKRPVIYKLDRTGALQDELPINHMYVEDIDVDDGSLWLMASDGGATWVERRDTDTGKIQAVTCTNAGGHHLEVSEGVAWVPGPDLLARVELPLESKGS